MYKVTKRDCPMFGIGPYVCEFICDTASDITTLPTSISEGTGGRTVYDNQKCASGSIAIVASGSESKQYMLNNQDIWCPYSIAAGSSSGGSGESSITVDFALSETSENPVANKAITAALNEKVNTSDLPDLSAYALKSKYGDTTINVGRKDGSEIGEYSTAEGYNTIASGYSSHAEGRGTTASSFCSHAGGYNTTALHNHEVAYGRYNKSNNNTLFSIGDGTADDARHNAFEITTTGGKLHDKSIATTDDIPDLSVYAKTADVPGIKVNEAVNADTVGGLRANQFVLGSAIVQLKTSINEYYTAGTASVEEQYTPDFPVGYGLFGLLDIRVYGSIVYQTIRFENGKIIHRARVLGATDWTEWAEIYTSGNKPYVTGSATVEANSDVCVSNHGFTPSAVIWWYSSGISGVSPIFNETQFSTGSISSQKETVNYLIFK